MNHARRLALNDDLRTVSYIHFEEQNKFKVSWAFQLIFLFSLRCRREVKTLYNKSCCWKFLCFGITLSHVWYKWHSLSIKTGFDWWNKGVQFKLNTNFFARSCKTHFASNWSWHSLHNHTRKKPSLCHSLVFLLYRFESTPKMRT